jgi:hypothetical protein
MSRPKTCLWAACGVVLLLSLMLGTTGGSAVADAPPPEAETGGVEGVEGTEAELFGSINTTGPSVSYRFQWGRSRSYGHVDPRYVEEFFGPSETGNQVEEIIECLRPHTTYHYRTVAYSRSGIAHGHDRTFKTTGLDAPRSVLYRYCPGHKPVS